MLNMMLIFYTFDVTDKLRYNRIICCARTIWNNFLEVYLTILFILKCVVDWVREREIWLSSTDAMRGTRRSTKQTSP